MPDLPAVDRRTVLRASALAIAGIGGCATDDTGTDPDATGGGTVAGGEAGGDGDGGDERSSAGRSTATDTDTPASTTERETTSGGGRDSTTDSTATDYDLREANVTAVESERTNGAYRFSITLYHDDDGEEGYADWWQVESIEGDRLGRRELLHAHSTAPFTRSETIEVPGDASCVVVRGHDQTHGYGGRAMLVNLDSGETSGVDQGSEKQSFDASDCP
ncbi:hypothetical protein [Halosimplex sp. TS25]|uniref:hypothetical protein n=1 Tax=Halosimplex rarum TaxID=3396619 RepID=UPI0039EAEE44